MGSFVSARFCRTGVGLCGGAGGRGLLEWDRREPGPPPPSRHDRWDTATSQPQHTATHTVEPRLKILFGFLEFSLTARGRRLRRWRPLSVRTRIKPYFFLSHLATHFVSSHLSTAFAAPGVAEKLAVSNGPGALPHAEAVKDRALGIPWFKNDIEADIEM